MCDANKVIREHISNMLNKKTTCDAGVTDVLALNVTSFLGKIMCKGHELRSRRKKIISQPEYPPLEGWLSHREKLNLMEKKMRERDEKKIHLRTADVSHKIAMVARKDLRKLTARDVRRFRFPCTVSLTLELEEDGFLFAASTLQGFIHYNENMRRLAVKGSPFFDQPPLSERPELLNRIAVALAVVDAETQSDLPDRALQIDTLLELAFALLDGGETVAWVVEKILLISIDLGSDYPKDGHKREALARFAYGCFLTKFDLLEHAVQELEIARNIALGKSWVLDFEYEKKYELLHHEITDVQARILLLMARRVRFIVPHQGVRYCSRIIRRVGDKALETLQAEAVFELGLAYKEAGDFIMALQAFLEYLNRYTDRSYYMGRALAYLEGALCYSRRGNIPKAQEFLHYVLKSAGEMGREDLTAVAQRYIGESFLNMGYFKEASRCLQESFKTYVKINRIKEMDYLRILAGISKGMEIMPEISDLLNECIDDRKGTHLLRLMRWRFQRTPFWDTAVEDAPVLPDETVYTHAPEEEDDDAIMGIVQGTLSEGKMVHLELTRKQQVYADKVERMRKRLIEEEGYSGAHVTVFLPGYNPEDDEMVQENVVAKSVLKRFIIAGKTGTELVQGESFFSQTKESSIIAAVKGKDEGSESESSGSSVDLEIAPVTEDAIENHDDPGTEVIEKERASIEKHDSGKEEIKKETPSSD